MCTTNKNSLKMTKKYSHALVVLSESIEIIAHSESGKVKLEEIYMCQSTKL